jgi:hypothetical protein
LPSSAPPPSHILIWSALRWIQVTAPVGLANDVAEAPLRPNFRTCLENLISHQRVSGRAVV